MNSPIRVLPGALLLAAIGTASADEYRAKLADGPDAVLVRARCSICHSVDYIPMNARFMNRAGWEAEVRKMVKVMGAPVSDDEAARILDYLAKNYGVAP